MARFHASLAVVCAATIMAACDTAPESTGPAGENFAVIAPEQATDPVVVSRSLPSFGGMFIDESGRPTVYLTDLADAPKARQILRGFAEDNDASPLAIQFI